ncbi:hypothetical protein AX15_007269 [Amanita polypyramis BW_CC]|nr:hypothetical protein AX15_007269 [Amanita polypyramis BW_CC]
MNLRSSAPNTPNKPRSVSGTPITTPTRKAPHCRKCKRPKAGHPRSGCPYVEENKPASTREATAEPDHAITNALSSLHISRPLEDDLTDKENAKPPPRSNTRRPNASATRLSLSTTAGEVFERLRRSDEGRNMFYDSVRRQSRVTRIVEWQHAVAAAMAPESDMDDTGSRSRHTSRGNMRDTTSPNARSRASRDRVDEGSSVSANSINPAAKASTTRPLIRSMSMEEREAFVGSLNQVSNATVYVLPKADIFEVQQAAAKVGFRSRVVMNEEDKSDLQALLVLARDDNSVKWLFGRIEKEDREAIMAKKQAQRSGHAISLVASGAVLGAVGAWAGLAFS